MTTQLFMYLFAIVASAVGAVVAIFAFLYHRREFPKINEWEAMRKGGKTLEKQRADLSQMKESLAGLKTEVHLERVWLTGAP